MESTVESLGFLLKYLDDSKAKHLLYILKKLGFRGDDILSGFLKKLFENAENRHRSWTKKSYHKFHGITEWEYTNNDFADIVYRQIKEEFAFKNVFFGNIKYLKPDGTEAVFKRINSLVKSVRADKFITATDIASYVFCPVSYCIKSTFEEDEPTEESRIGTELHEKHRLAALAAGSKRNYEFTASGKGKGFYNQYNFEFFDDIRSSRIYYLGHDQESKRYFKSSKGKLVGQPDYVFVNRDGIRFVVEEKFRPIAKQTNAIRSHHKAQLISYILGLDELEAMYGYLIYWYYIYEGEKRIVSKCTVFKVEPTADDRELVRNTYRAISSLNAGEQLKFSPNELNAAKCASCVVCRFCGHKTGRFDEIAVPYVKEFYSLVTAR